MVRPPQNKRSPRTREPKEFEEVVLQVARVTRVVKGGRRLRFRATVVIGNRKGKVGLGIGKSSEVSVAIQKAVAQAKKDIIEVPIVKETVPHEVKLKFKAAEVMVMPANAGKGIIAGGAMRQILELAGYRNIIGKRFGTSNIVANAQAVIEALRELQLVPGQKADEMKEEKKAEKAKKTKQVVRPAHTFGKKEEAKAEEKKEEVKEEAPAEAPVEEVKAEEAPAPAEEAKEEAPTEEKPAEEAKTE